MSAVAQLLPDEQQAHVLRTAMREWLDKYEDEPLVPPGDVDAMYAMYTKLCSDMRRRS